jgi:short-subunit dehydrogenase
VSGTGRSSLIAGDVLITGASGGLGRAIALAFAARGARLTLSGRRIDVLEALAGELGARALGCDLADRAQLEHLLGDLGPVDVLVANAGVPASGEFTELSQEQIDRMLEVNLRAPIRLARALVPGMIERGRGHLVLMSSLAGKAASPVSAIYSATKFGLRGFGLGLRPDLRSHGVGVSVLLPGFIRDAGMFADAGVALPPGVGTRTPQDVASAVIRAIERDRAEIDVAPLALRVGASIAAVAPQLAESASRMMGSERIAGSLAHRQRHKR